MVKDFSEIYSEINKADIIVLATGAEEPLIKNSLLENKRNLLIVDLKETNQINLPRTKREESLYKALILGVKDYFSKTGHHQAVIGLSGGIDSSLTACIAVEALGKNNVYGRKAPHNKQTSKTATCFMILRTDDWILGDFCIANPFQVVKYLRIGSKVEKKC